jgi:hypothetical protein
MSGHGASTPPRGRLPPTQDPGAGDAR